MTAKKRTPKKRRRPYGRVCARPGGKGHYVQIVDPSGRRLPNGRKAVLTRSVRSKSEGEKLLRELRREQLRGTLVSPAAEPEWCDLTVAEAVANYVGSRRGAGCAESTLKIYGYSLKALERNGIGKRLVRDVTPAAVEKYLTWRRTHVWQTRRNPGEDPEAVPLKGGTASPSTVARDRELLCGALNRLVRLGQIAENPVAKVPKPKRRARKRTVLSKAEVSRLIAACNKHLKPVALTLAYTGCRKSEALGLRWADVNFETSTLSLFRSKTGNASAIPLHPVLAEEFRLLKEGRAKARGRPIPDSEHVFLSRYGRRYRCFRTAWTVAIRKAGLEDRGVTPHALRHSFACHFLEGGAAVTDLQAVLGHASLNTTQIYARMVDQRTRASVEALRF